MKRNGGVLCLAALLALPAVCEAQGKAGISSYAPFGSKEDAETFLRTAKIVKARNLGTGVTLPQRLTLDDGKLRHDGIFKSIDERKTGVTKLTTSNEFDFKDSWKFEVAAYQLDRLLDLDMVPVTVERTYARRTGSLQFWVENCMTESDRQHKNMKPPDPEAWNQQMYKVRIFDNLIYNIDRNLRNLLITQEWKCFMVDHSRAFKSVGFLKSPADLTHFSRSLLERLKTLNDEAVKKECGRYLNGLEISTLLMRRDRILRHFEQLQAKSGSSISYP
jgi:hypothetical protein